MAANSLNCPGCGTVYLDLPNLREAGGKTRMIGLAMKAKCPSCGRWFAVGQSWRPKRRHVIDATKELER